MSHNLRRKPHTKRSLNGRIWDVTTKVLRCTKYGVIHLAITNEENLKLEALNVHRGKYRVYEKLYIPSDMNVIDLCHNSLIINTDHISLEPQHINNNRNF